MTNDTAHNIQIPQKLYISLGIHSAAIIAFQLVLMQLLSIVQWHHFAFMIIAIAMLGFGASGTFIALFRKRLIANFDLLYPLLMILTGISMMIVFPLSRIGVLELDVFRLFSDSSQLWVLGANYLIFFLPFFLGATSIGMIFIKHPEVIGKCYFSNLVGSGLGGIMVLFITGWLFPEQLMVITGVLSVIAGIMSSPKFKKPLFITISAISVVIATIMLAFPFDLNPSEYKSISKTLNLPEAEIEKRIPDTHGVIEVVSSPALRYAPSLSMSFTGRVPVKKNVFLNGNFYGVIPEEPGERPHIHSYTTMALPYVINDRPEVLILNAGTGSNISHALSSGVQRLDATINNISIINLMEGPYSEISGDLFTSEKVNLHHSDVRIYLSSISGQKYDLIKLPVMEAFGGTSGLASLQENYELTIEAFKLMWQALKDDGVIAVTSWMDYPARTSLKIAATLAKTARNMGIDDPEEHIVAIRSWGNISFILKKTPLTNEEIEKIRHFCDNMYFDPAFMKGISAEEKEYYNKMEDHAFFTYLDEIIMTPNPLIYKDYGFSIAPATDDKPFFSQFLRLKNLPHIISIYGFQQLPYLELGYLTVVVTLVQSTLLAVILIVLPLFWLRNTGKKKSNIFLFFSAIGIGYMFLEIILIQKFVLYFGYPIYAITAVISTMLIASGAGSLYSAKVKYPGRSVALVSLIILSVLFVYAIFLSPVLQGTLSFSRPLKIFIALILIAIPAFFMGMPFPMAIRHLSKNSPALIPWSWGINGCFSVISSALAMFLALEIGFTSVMIGAVICYALAFLSFSGNIKNRTLTNLFAVKSKK